MNTYQVLVETYSSDHEVEVTVTTDADLNNCDEDMFMSAIEEELELMGFNDIAHFEIA